LSISALFADHHNVYLRRTNGSSGLFKRQAQIGAALKNIEGQHTDLTEFGIWHADTSIEPNPPDESWGLQQPPS
jgi:hypothetical protein